MTKLTISLRLSVQTTVFSAFLALLAASASAGLVDPDTPRLLPGSGSLDRFPLVLQGMQPTGRYDSPLTTLRRSMEQLVEQRVTAPLSMRDRTAAGDRLQTALRGLSGGGQSSLSSTEPRIAGRPDQDLRTVNGIADVESQLARIRRPGVGGDTHFAARPVSGLRTLHRAMQRFERASGVVASDTFARVFVGMDDKVPMLSNLAAQHASVPARDLRTRLVAARTASAASSVMPSLVTPATGLRLGDVDLPASASTDLTDLVGSLDQVALGNFSGQSDPRMLGRAGYSDAEYADAEYAIDEIELEDLGVGLASSEAPVGVDQLQDTRAGFLLDNGIRVDFSVTRLTVIDGLDQQQAQNLANMPLGLNPEALTQIAAGQAGNTRVITPADGSSAFTVVQNALDNQNIIDVTTFNIDIKGAGLRSLDFIPQSLLPEAHPAELR